MHSTWGERVHLIAEETAQRPSDPKKRARNTRALLLVVVLLAAFMPIPFAAPAIAGHGDVTNPLHLDGGPETETNFVGTAHTFTATVTDAIAATAPQPGINVNFEFEGDNDTDGGFTPLTPDRTCTTDAGGDCQVKVTGTVVGTLTATSWVDDVVPTGTADFDETETPTATENDDDTDVMVKFWVPLTDDAAVLNVEPETDTNPVGTFHTFVATVTASTGEGVMTGTNVDFEFGGTNDPGTPSGFNPVPPDGSCTTNVNGTCSVTVFGGSIGTMTATGWVDINGDGSATEVGGVDTDEVEKGWRAVADNELRLNLDPETDSNTAGDTHTVTGTVTTTEGQPVSGTTIDFELQGANDPDGGYTPTGSVDDECTTNAQGICSIEIFGQETGTTTVTGWVDADGSSATSEADHAEGLADDSDDTDVVRKVWTAAAPTVLNVEPESDINEVNTDHTFTATVTDEFGNAPTSSVTVDFEYEGANDPDNNTDPTSIEDSCTAGPGNGGICSVTLGDSDATGTAESTTETGTTTATAWIDSDSNNSTSEANTETVNDFADDDTDVVTKHWTAASPTVIDIEPETDANRVGTDHTVTATVTDAFGNVPTTTVNVDFEYEGDNDPDGDSNLTTVEDSCNAGPANGGVCSVTLGDSDTTGTTETTDDVGNTVITGWIDADGSNATAEGNAEPLGDNEDDDTDVVEKDWETGEAVILDVSPETDANKVGTTHTFTATVTDAIGQVPTNTVTVDFEYTGANDPDGNSTQTSIEDSCTAGPANGGVCTVTLGDSDATGTTETTNEDGTTTATAWIDSDGTNTTSEANSEAADDAEDDDTDVVLKSWRLGDAVILDVSPENDSNPINSDHTFTATVTDEFGNVPTNTVTVDFEYTGANDPDGNSTQTSIEDTCTAGPGNSGVCSVTLGDSDATGATETTDEEGTTTATAWIDSDASNTTSEADSESAGDAEDDDTDVVLKQWTAAVAEVLDIGPESASNQTGTAHTWTATVTDSIGNPVSGSVVDFEYTGANDPDGNSTQTSVEDTCTTGANGRCTVTLGDSDGVGQTETTSATGTTTATAWIDSDESDTTSEADSEALGDTEDDDTDVAVKQWTAGAEPPPPTQEFEVTIPEGATHSGFHTFVLIANPSTTTATDVDITFLTPSGPTPGPQNLSVPAGSRRTIDVNAELATPADVGTKVTSQGVEVAASAAVHKAGSLSEMIMNGQTAQPSWLMAEGATHSGFTTFITIANPDTATQSVVDVSFFKPGGTTDTVDDLVVPAGGRRTVNVNTELGSASDVSTLVEVDSGPDVVAGRSLHKEDSGDLAIGGSEGATGPANTHVVAEGATHSDWHTFVLVFSQATSTVDVDFLTSSGIVPGPQNQVVNGRFTVDVNALLAASDDVATLIDVDSGAPVAVEGTVQKADGTGFVIADSVSSGGSSIGDASGTKWLVSEGATHSGFKTFILISNPNSTPATVDVDFLTQSGGLIAGPQNHTIPAQGRETFSVDIECNCVDDVSTLVEADSGTVVVEVAVDRVIGGSGFSKGRSLAYEI